jgi:hypothetical protein
MKKRGITCSAVSDQGWGLITQVSLPGGGKLGIYEPRHARPKPASSRAKQAPVKRGARKTPATKAARARRTKQRAGR